MQGNWDGYVQFREGVKPLTEAEQAVIRFKNAERVYTDSLKGWSECKQNIWRSGLKIDPAVACSPHAEGALKAYQEAMGELERATQDPDKVAAFQKQFCSTVLPVFYNPENQVGYSKIDQDLKKRWHDYLNRYGWFENRPEIPPLVRAEFDKYNLQ